MLVGGPVLPSVIEWGAFLIQFRQSNEHLKQLISRVIHDPVRARAIFAEIRGAQSRSIYT